MLVGQPGVLKQVNEDIIKDYIYEKGPISKPELAAATKLSLPTVNKIVDCLEEKNLVRQEGMIGSSSGRKAKTYVANESAGNIIALYFWDNTYIATLINMIGQRFHTVSVEVNTGSAKEALESTYKIIDELSKKSTAPIKAIGIGVPGVVKKDNTISSIPSIKGWEGLNLKEVIEKKYNLPVYVENDVKLTTIGYYHDFLEKKYDNIVYLYVGKGIGSGIILNRILYRGFTSFAGEFGYLAAPSAKEANYAKDGGWLETKINEDPEDLENLLTIGIADYIAMLNPEAIVIQSRKLKEESLENIRKKLEHYIPEDNIPKLISTPRNDCGLDGIFKMCMAGIFTSRKLVDKKKV